MQTYEFSSAFRGESYEWHPHAPEPARSWHALLVLCLRNQVSELTIEAADGRRWSVVWTPKNRNQVRGGSLQITVMPNRAPAPVPAVDAPSIMRTAVALLTGAKPARLSPELWRALTEPSSDIARYFDAIELTVPSYAAFIADASVRRQLDELGDQVELVITSPKLREPSPAGRLLIEWVEGASWLTERVGAPRMTAPELLTAPQRSRMLSALEQLASLAEAPIEGWEPVEQAVSRVDAVAQGWTGSAARWQVRQDASAREPTLDVRAGIIDIPGDGDSRRARKLVESVGGQPIEPEPSSVHDPAGFNGRVVSVGVVAFALGLVVGFGCAWVWIGG